MKFCYNTNFTLPEQSQRSRCILEEGSISLGLLWKEKTLSYNQRNTVLKLILLSKFVHAYNYHYLLQGSNSSLILLGQLQCCRNFCRVGDNFCIQLPTFLHESLFTLVWLLEGLVKFFIFSSKPLETPVSHELLQDLFTRKQHRILDQAMLNLIQNGEPQLPEMVRLSA